MSNKSALISSHSQRGKWNHPFGRLNILQVLKQNFWFIYMGWVVGMGDCILNKTGRRGSHWQGCCYSSRGTWPRVICKNGESDWVDNDMGIVGQSSMLSALSGCYTLCHDGSPANQPLWILLLPPVGQLGKKIPVWWNTKLEIYQGQTGKSALRLFTSFVCCSLFWQYLLRIETLEVEKLV